MSDFRWCKQFHYCAGEYCIGLILLIYVSGSVSHDHVWSEDSERCECKLCTCWYVICRYAI